MRWLSLGPSIERLLEQWDILCHFVEEIGKDDKTKPKSFSFKHVALAVNGKDKCVTEVMLAFLHNITPIFEDFLTVFQKNSPMVHVLYDNMCHTLLKLMRRFLKPKAIAEKYGSTLTLIDCKDTNNQLTDRDIVIGETTRNALKPLTPEKQRYVMLGIRSFYKAAISHLQTALPFNNELLRALSCMNPKKRTAQSSQVWIQTMAKKLQPHIDVSKVLDEWRLYQVDSEVKALADQKFDRVDHFWNTVFKLDAVDSSPHF